MALWKFDAFSNDDALDFVGILGMLSDQKKLSIMEDALLTIANNTEYLELPDVCGAVVSAALVAIQLSPSLMPEEPTIEEVIRKLPDVSSLKDLARRALERVLQPNNNEWLELISEDTAGLLEMTNHIADYREVLST